MNTIYKNTLSMCFAVCLLLIAAHTHAQFGDIPDMDMPDVDMTEADNTESAADEADKVITDASGNMVVNQNSDIDKSINATKGNVNIGSGSTINGDVIVQSGNLIAGHDVTITGNVKVLAGSLTAGDNFDVAGTIDAKKSNLNFGSNLEVGMGMLVNGFTAGSNITINGDLTILGSGPVTIGSNSDISGTLTAAGGLTVGSNTDITLFLSGKTVTIKGTVYKLGGNVIARGNNSDIGMPYVPKTDAGEEVQYGTSVAPSAPSGTKAPVGKISTTGDTSGDIPDTMGIKKMVDSAIPSNTTLQKIVANEINARTGQIVIDGENGLFETDEYGLANDLGDIVLKSLDDSSSLLEMNQGNLVVNTDETFKFVDKDIFVVDENEDLLPVSIVPVEAMDIAGFTDNLVKSMSLAIENNDPVYTIVGEQTKKLFGLFNVSMQVETKTSATNGDVIAETKPWWSFLAF